MENWDAKPAKPKKPKKPPKKFTIYPIRQQDDYYVPPKQLIAPFDELVNKGGGNLLLIGPPSSGKSVYANDLILSEEAFKDCFEMMYCMSPCSTMICRVVILKMLWTLWKPSIPKS